MECHEGVAPVFIGKVLAIVEGDAERSRMSLEEHIGDGHLGCKVGAVPLAARIFIAADVVPGPAVKLSLSDFGSIFEGHVVAELIALIDNAPRRAGSRVDRHPRAIAQTGGKYLLVFAVRIDDENIGPALFGVPGSTERMGFVEFLHSLEGLHEHIESDIRPGPDSNIELVAFGGEDDVAGPMVRGGDITNDVLGLTRRFHVATLVRETDDAVAVGDIDPFRVRARLIERNSIGLIEAGGEYLVLFRFRT